MTTRTLILLGAVFAAIAVVFLVAVPTWERPPHSQEVGARGTNMVQFTRPWEKNPLDVIPAAVPLPAGPADTRSAREAYKNVQALGDVPASQFMRLQYAMTQWVAPKEGCGFCHEGTDYASDANPRKEIARRMLAMTRDINSQWQDHVGTVGVTCFTCHRGQPMPPKAWFLDTPFPRHGILGKPSEYKEATHSVRDFFPNDGWEEYLLEGNPIHVESRTATPSGDIGSWAETTRIYEMMMQLSDGMGVNCTYCHNSTNFSDWKASPPARYTALTGFRMTQKLNQAYLWPLRAVMPQARVGPHPTQDPTYPPREMMAQDGNGLVNCATCHVGSPKPLQGARMLDGYPELGHAAPTQVSALSSPATPVQRQDQVFMDRLAAENR